MNEGAYAEIKAAVRKQLDLCRELNDQEIEEIIDDEVLRQTKSYSISTKEKIELSDTIFNSLRRLDVLQPFLEDETITEIMVNGFENVFYEQEGRLQKASIKFESQEKLEDVIQSIVAKINRVVNESSPICDARLQDGSRVNIVLPPVALNGPILTIRKFSKSIISMEKLIEWGTITKEAAEFLNKAILAKYNIFISGGTGSGKTTLLNILSNFIPRDERIITIEDSAELQIQNIQNLVRLETKTANTEGKGTICIKDLIKSSLRMRPDRIIVGEVRGAEAIDMLQCMNTGHDGSLSTGHSNSTIDMLGRLETMILTEENIPIEVIRRQISGSIDLMVHMTRMRDKTRKVVEISELIGVENNEILINPIFKFIEDLSSKNDQVIGSLCATGSDIKNIDKFVGAGIQFGEGMV